MTTDALLAATTPRPWEARQRELGGGDNYAPDQVWAHGYCLFSDEYRYAKDSDVRLIVVAVNEYEPLNGLAQYARHHEVCARTVTNGGLNEPGVAVWRGPQCDCGLDDWLLRLDAIRKG